LMNGSAITVPRMSATTAIFLRFMGLLFFFLA
jgi:hypothetical protein